MASQKRILVTGATGAQGGSVARHLLQKGNFAVRALTRNPDSDKAQALKAIGAELVKGDLDDLDSLRAALEGVYGVFGVTNFWEHFGKEYQHGKNLVDAVAGANVEHFVFSTLPHVKKITHGELDTPHFDIKAQLEEYTRSLKLNATFVHVSFYFENFVFFFPPQKQEDGTFRISFPQGETPLAGIAVEDLGGIIAPIFDRPDEFQGKVVVAVGDFLPVRTYAELMTQILGKTIVYKHISRETFASLGFPGADDLANMFDFYRRYILDRQKELEQCRALYPNLQTFETWLKASKEKFATIL
ncbi:NmrA-like family domain-containing protein 1 [Candidatus Vecturithrix granuli]|uniref:NmrA-like family domain-containing protein 1 n=1 Tax=Vecturithrix granuli TaxID=1499967 RepID=A0A081C5N4_VECG1|nr:NmrA-like family domain-containing protein 1 [Candidatus Vecturithrix granuli]